MNTNVLQAEVERCVAAERAAWENLCRVLGELDEGTAKIALDLYTETEQLRTEAGQLRARVRELEVIEDVHRRENGRLHAQLARLEGDDPIDAAMVLWNLRWVDRTTKDIKAELREAIIGLCNQAQDQDAD